MSKTVLCAALCAAMAVASSAEAQGLRLVRLNDVNLNTLGGAAEALHRLQAAAKLYCGVKQNGSITYIDAAVMRCRRDLVESAIATTDAPLVRALYDVSRGSPPPSG